MIENSSISLWILVFSTVIGSFSIAYLLMKKKYPEYMLSGKFSKESIALFNALKECHLKNYSEYFLKIKTLAEIFPEEPLFFLFAGDIARRSDSEKALEIHRDVLFRPSISETVRAITLKHIAEDYINLKQNKKAISVLKDAVKSTNFPDARLLLSKVYEKEGSFDNAFSEMEKYLSSSNLKEKSYLAKLTARAVHHYVKNNDDEKATVWLELLVKKLTDTNEINIAEFMIALIKGKEKKAAALLKSISESGEQYEILCRGLLLKYKNGAEINYSVEGKYKEVFHLIFNPDLKNDEAMSVLNKKSAVYGRLLSNWTTDAQCREFIVEAITFSTFFVCSECGMKTKILSPVCKSCQKITGRKFKIMSED